MLRKIHPYITGAPYFLLSTLKDIVHWKCGCLLCITTHNQHGWLQFLDRRRAFHEVGTCTEQAESTVPVKLLFTILSQNRLTHCYHCEFFVISLSLLLTKPPFCLTVKVNPNGDVDNFLQCDFIELHFILVNKHVLLSSTQFRKQAALLPHIDLNLNTKTLLFTWTSTWFSVFTV